MIVSMRLKCFRKHVDREFTFSQGLNVVRAENEAGKSTLMSAILYMLFGTRALGQPLEEVVTYGHSKRELSVEGEFVIDGVEYHIKRSDSGAELTYGNQSVTGQTGVTRFVENLFGASLDTVRKILVAEQNSVRGALDSEAGAGALIESLADLDKIDDLIQKIKSQRPCGPTKAAEAVAKSLRDSIPQVCEYPSDEQVLDAEVALSLAEAKVQAARSEHDFRKDAAERAMNELRKIDSELAERSRALSLKAKLESVQHPGEKPWSDSQLAEASALEADASRAAFVQKQRSVKFKTHAASFDGDAKEGLSQLRRELQVAETTLASTKSEYQKLALKTINEGQCAFCKKDIGELPEVLKYNSEIKAKLEPLHARCKELVVKVGELKSDIRLVEELLEVEAYNIRLAHPDFWKKSDGRVPSSFTWIGPEEAFVGQVSVPYAKMVSENLSHENAVRKFEQAQQELAELVIPQDRSSEKSGHENEISVYELTKEALVKAKSEADKAAYTLDSAKMVFASELLRYTESKDRREVAMREADKAEALIVEMEFYNQLIRDLAAARLEIRKKLWGIVSAAISHYFTNIRGEVTIVEQGENGFTENGRPVKGLSGSAKDTLGLAIRAALSKVFIPGAALMIVDEPFAACDAERELAGIGVLAGLGFDQTILVTHSDLADAVADKIIQL